MRLNKDRLQMYISLTKITIVLCWLSLFSFWAIKLFGGNLFEIIVNNENFLKFSNAVQNTWLKCVVSFVTITIANHFTFGAIAQKFVLKGKHLCYFWFADITMWIVANFIIIDFVQMFYGYILIIGYGIVIHKSWKKTFGLISVAMEFVFSTVSMLTRNVPLQVMSNYLITLILIIDIQIMYALYYLYSNLIRLKTEVK